MADSFVPDDGHYMGLALAQARAAADVGEVPVGAVLVHQGRVIAAAHNAPRGLCDPTAHAEMRVLRQGAQALGNYRLTDCTLYVTAEPCTMCAGAILHARLPRVVYATAEPRMGAAGSQLNVFAVRALNPHTQVQGGVGAEAAQALMRTFFAQRRAQQTREQPPRLREDALRLPQAAQAGLLAALDWAALGVEPRAQAIALTGLQHVDAATPRHTGTRPTQAADTAATLAADAMPSAATRNPDAPVAGGHGRSDLGWRMWGVVSAPNLGAAAADARAEGRTSRPPGSVALVHGWADHGSVWRDWAQALATQGWRVLVPDLLGHGLSDKPRRAGGLTSEQVGQALAQWLWAQGWAGEEDAAHPQPGVAAGQPRAADAPRAAPAGPCVLIADRSVAGAVHAAWRALAQRAQGSGQADAWRRVARLRWVSRPTLREALAAGADAGAGAERAAVDRRLTDAFPATPATLARLLALLEGHGLRSGPESRHEWQYGCNAVDQETTMAPYPDAGHLVRCRDWVRRLRAGGDAVAMGGDAEALLEQVDLGEAGGVVSLPVPAPRKVLDVPLFGPRWPWTDPVQAAMARLRDGG